ncbi:MAG: low molecular weight phosphotyrosine protein phosphatase [Actinomycetota bacterium]|jgi:protein-tyrosine phosphatase|nr:low molecular weight phosphotyrosine protein phosphatase [Actinomycetota bacterium]
MDIAMVCLGNICRSPMAESVAGALVREAGLADFVSVESFGTAAYHVGERAHPQADAALRRRGWPAGHHRARHLQRRDLVRLDLVLCADQANLADVRRLAGPAGVTELAVADLLMEGLRAEVPRTPPGGGDGAIPPVPSLLGAGSSGSPHVALLRSFDPGTGPDDAEVPDPWGGPDADFDHALDLIERACRGLVAYLADYGR